MTADTIRSYDQTNLFTDDELQLDGASYSNNADGLKASMADNAIAMNLFAQVDVEGNRHALFDEITDHRTDGKEIKQQ